MVDAAGALVHSAKLDLPAPVMMHDFVITEEHAVFLDSPIVFDIANLGKGPMVQWRPENGTRIGVMPRRGTAEDVRWFEIDPGHVQHFWNGWADGDRIEFSGTRFEHPDFGIDGTAAEGESTVDHDAAVPGARSGSTWPPAPPVGADRRPGRRLRPVQRRVRRRAVPLHYMSAVVDPDRRLGDFDTIVRYDDATGERQVWSSGPSGHVGESVFAPDPAGTGEDDGWLLNAVYDDATDRTDLCVLDARDVAAGPIARVHLPRPDAVRLPCQLVRRQLTRTRTRAGLCSAPAPAGLCDSNCRRGPLLRTRLRPFGSVALWSGPARHSSAHGRTIGRQPRAASRDSEGRAHRLAVATEQVPGGDVAGAALPEVRAVFGSTAVRAVLGVGALPTAVTQRSRRNNRRAFASSVAARPASP